MGKYGELWWATAAMGHIQWKYSYGKELVQWIRGKLGKHVPLESPLRLLAFPAPDPAPSRQVEGLAAAHWRADVLRSEGNLWNHPTDGSWFRGKPRCGSPIGAPILGNTQWLWNIVKWSNYWQFIKILQLPWRLLGPWTHTRASAVCKHFCRVSLWARVRVCQEKNGIDLATHEC